MHIITIKICSILIDSGFYDELKVVEVDRKITMAYEVTTNELRLNPTMVEKFLEDDNMYYYYSEDEILNAMVYHELGHYLEFKNNPNLANKARFHHTNGTFEEYKKFCIEREKVAWELGKGIISDEYKDAFEYLNMKNMRNYENMKLTEY